MKDKWEPMTWGHILDLWKDVPKDEPVYEVKLTSFQGKYQITNNGVGSPRNLKEWRKRVKEYKEGGDVEGETFGEG